MKALKLSVLGAFLLVLIWGCVPRDYHEYICFHCRCGHTLGNALGVPYKTYNPTGLTRWYAERFPGHIHQWLHLGHYRTMPLGATFCSSVGGSSMMMNPFWVVTENEQLDFLESGTGVELYRLSSFLAEDKQRDAVDLILEKQTPPRVICDNFAGFDRECRARVLDRERAIQVTKDDGLLYFCSEACRDHYRSP